MSISLRRTFVTKWGHRKCYIQKPKSVCISGWNRPLKNVFVFFIKSFYFSTKANFSRFDQIRYKDRHNLPVNDYFASFHLSGRHICANFCKYLLHFHTTIIWRFACEEKEGKKTTLGSANNKWMRLNQRLTS